MPGEEFYDWTAAEFGSFAAPGDGIVDASEPTSTGGPGSRHRANRRSGRPPHSDMPASPGAKRSSPSGRQRGHEPAAQQRAHASSPPTPASGRPGSLPGGFRSSRRTTHAGKANRRDLAWYRGRLAAINAGKRTAIVLVGLIVGLVVAAGALVLIANGINMAARWYAGVTATSVAQTQRHEQARENLLVIGIKDGKAAGFLAARVELKTRRIFGIAIPDGAFVEVPGQGFERIGDSYTTGADTAKAAVSNYLSVPFERYIAVPYEAYQAALQNQSLQGITKDVQATDISANDLQLLTALVDGIATKDVAIVPLPVKPITIGSQRFFQPQRQQVADLLKTWWGVSVGPDDRVRIIVQNGVGQPGVAGEAAKQLIGTGFSVVDTKNAAAFGHKKTLIVLYRGPTSNAERVKQVLKVGEIQRGVSDQDLADIIVVVGSDYVPPAAK